MMIILFILFQFLNVVSSTIKSIVTIKCKKQLIVGLVNAINYVINFTVIKFTGSIEMPILLTTTFFSNLIGTPLGRIIIDKISKDRLFVIDSTIKCDLEEAKLIKEIFNKQNISVLYLEVKENKLYEIKFFSTSKEESKKIKDFLDNKNAHYYIVEAK